jgi:hypothetical protein
MANEALRKVILERIRKGHSVTLKKGVPAKKSPTGKAIKATKKAVHGVESKLLFAKAMARKTNVSDLELEAELGRMRKEEIIVCTNGIWWEKAHQAKALKAVG